MQIEYEDDFLPEDEERGEFQEQFDYILNRFRARRGCIDRYHLMVELYNLVLEVPAIVATNPALRDKINCLLLHVLDGLRAHGAPLKLIRRLRIQYRKFFDSLRVLDIWEK